MTECDDLNGDGVELRVGFVFQGEETCAERVEETFIRMPTSPATAGNPGGDMELHGRVALAGAGAYILEAPK